MSQFSIEQVRATYKARDSWWTVLLVDPVVGRLVRVAAGHRWITPNLLTGVGFLLGVAAAVCFFQARPGWLVVGALVYHLGFMIDCMDGKIARLRGDGSVFGGWLDFFLDRVRVILCVVFLFAGHWRRTDDEVFLFATTAVVFLALFGYVNGAETDKARARLVTGRRRVDNDELLTEAAGRAAGLARRVSAALHRRRIRLNLISGIEFEMAVLIVAPVTAAFAGPYGLLWVTGAAAVLLAGFEAALIMRFWLATRAAGSAADVPGADVPGDVAASAVARREGASAAAGAVEGSAGAAVGSSGTGPVSDAVPRQRHAEVERPATTPARFSSS